MSLMPFHLEKQNVAPGTGMGNYIKGLVLQVKHKDDTRQGVVDNGVVITVTWTDLVPEPDRNHSRNKMLDIPGDH